MRFDIKSCVTPDLNIKDEGEVVIETTSSALTIINNLLYEDIEKKREKGEQLSLKELELRRNVFSVLQIANYGHIDSWASRVLAEIDNEIEKLEDERGSK